MIKENVNDFLEKVETDDVRKEFLTSEELKKLAPDLGYCVRIWIQKTDTETMLLISDEALQLCGERTEGKVFRGLTRSMVNYPLRKWSPHTHEHW